jgi:hypothetical protein
MVLNAPVSFIMESLYEETMDRTANNKQRRISGLAQRFFLLHCLKPWFRGLETMAITEQRRWRRVLKKIQKEAPL